MKKILGFVLAMSVVGGAFGGTAFDSKWSVQGKRVISINSVIRVNQIEVSRTCNKGTDEAHLHTVAAAERFRKAVSDAIPEAKVTWAFSWLALKDERPNYVALRKRVVEFHHQYGDEITFIPGAYFAPMYNSRAQTNRDLHDGLARVSEMVGGGYRPHGVVAGFLAADNLRYLAEVEGIHVAQGTIWSQYGIDNGDGDGSICYPYYPSREHACKPAQGGLEANAGFDCEILDICFCYQIFTAIVFHLAKVYDIVSSGDKHIYLDSRMFIRLLSPPGAHIGHHTGNTESVLDLWNMLEAYLLESKPGPGIVLRRITSMLPVHFISEGILLNAAEIILFYGISAGHR